MTWDNQERSIDQSNPVELYRFEGQLGVYTFTSSDYDYIDGGTTYRAVSITRTEIMIGTIEDENKLTITLPISEQIVEDYLMDVAPTTLNVTIYRVHPDTGLKETIFTGEVASGGMANNTATFTVPSIFTMYMASEFPNLYYQAQCNHPLYSNGCGLLRADYSLTGTVESVTSRHVISVLAAADRPSGWFTAGEIHTSTERRLIVSHDAGVLKVNFPFRSISPGDAITLYAGCDHTIETCKAKFANELNFLGFPYTPGVNPFKSGLSV